MADRIHACTGRPLGDHGTANDALEFALDDPCGAIGGDAYNLKGFLEDWREGAAYEEWPEFYEWLKEQGR